MLTSTQTREDIKWRSVPTSSLYYEKWRRICILPSLIYRAAGAMGDNGWFMGALSFSPTKAYVKSFFYAFNVWLKVTIVSWPDYSSEANDVYYEWHSVPGSEIANALCLFHTFLDTLCSILYLTGSLNCSGLEAVAFWLYWCALTVESPIDVSPLSAQCNIVSWCPESCMSTSMMKYPEFSVYFVLHIVKSWTCVL